MWLFYTQASIFSLLAACCGSLVLVGLPGIWMMIALAVLNELANVLHWGQGGHWFAWTAIGGAVAIALAAEVIELFSAVAGAKLGGASKSGMLGALVGGVSGCVIGTLLLPCVGTLAGAALGAAVGAIVCEVSFARRTFKESLVPAAGAAGGRIAGLFAKISLAIAAWIVLVVGAFWR